MEPVSMDIDTTQQLPADPLPFARSYQLEALEKAIKHNTIAFLETGSGKTLIAIMLLRSYSYLLREPSCFKAVFLVPKVVLVKQQAEAVRMHTDLNVGMYWGEMGVDYWDATTWDQEISKHEVLVMTPQILLNGLRHSFFKLDLIKVLIFDECHHAKGKDPYACIMTEFYLQQLMFGNPDLPRIFGMTASPIKSKGGSTELSYWKEISELENIMNSKVYTCVSESVLANFIPFSTPKFLFYDDVMIPARIYAYFEEELGNIKAQHEFSLKHLDLNESTAESACNKISKVHSALMFCLGELGIWFAFKAAQIFSRSDNDFISLDKLDMFGETRVKNFSRDASLAFSNHITAGPEWRIGDDAQADVDAGLLTKKIICFIESLLQYRELKDIRCIVFVERVVTAVVLQSLLGELLPRHCSWRTEYIAGNNTGLQSQTRKTQNEIVEEFRKGMVNIIIATSILEEGLDVQSCNLVFRFDPSTTVSSFIQSRGRARMQNSDYVLMVKRGDFSTHARLENYLASGDIMRRESLRHASLPCSPLLSELCDDEFYGVESTGAIVTLAHSVSLMYFYCARLPSDGYFKPAPRCVIDKEMGTCTLHLPKSCPVQTVCVQGNVDTVKQKACLEACKQLHLSGALTDNLVPYIVAEEGVAQEVGNEWYDDEQPIYFPPELVSQGPRKEKTDYFCYFIELNQSFDYSIPVHDVVLAVRDKLDSDILSTGFELEAEQGILTVNLKFIGNIQLCRELVLLCRRFQITLFKVLMDRSANQLEEVLKGLKLGTDPEIDYLVLPGMRSHPQQPINWTTINSALFSYEEVWGDHVNCCMKEQARVVQTHGGPVCSCVLQNCLVYTPHNGNVYCITGIFEGLNGRSLLKRKDGGAITYKEYYATKHGIQLRFDGELFLKGRHIFSLHNFLNRGRKQKEKESRNAFVELPPELCHIILSPITISTLYSYTFIPSIMHRLESLLIAANLKKFHLDHCMQNAHIPVIKVLEAITTKKCQEKFHLESLETLGDSFLKYAVSQQLFKTYQSDHEGLLSVKKDRIISNASLCNRGCDHKLQGFIRNESFDPKDWPIPGVELESNSLIEESLFESRKIYVKGVRRKLKSKTVADVVEALIGAFLSSGGETPALLLMNWIGIKVDFIHIPYERNFQLQAEKFVNIDHFKSILNGYSFSDPCLLVEALTHGSYMLPEIPRCYQRLEFLGDSVLDYLITVHLYKEYPGMSPGLLTDMRSASVNNDCYALSAVKAGLHKYILHASPVLHKHIVTTVKNFEELLLESTFGWESETSFPKVLGDVIESLAGAIFVDCGFNKEVVFQSLRPLLEPLVTPETLKFNPTRELNELCQKQHFKYKKRAVAHNNTTMSSFTIEVEADGVIFKHTASAADKKTAKKLASKEVLKAIKDNLSRTGAA